MTRPYSIRLLRPAIRELAGLDTRVAQRITDRIRWSAERIETARMEALKGDLSGLFKLREGT